MPLISFPTKGVNASSHVSNAGVCLTREDKTADAGNTGINYAYKSDYRSFNDIESVQMGLVESRISNGSEWIVFEPVDEEHQDRDEHSGADSNSILSTRLSSYRSEFRSGPSDVEATWHIISDFNRSLRSSEETDFTNLETDEEDEEESEDDEDDDDADDDDEDHEYHDHDRNYADSLVDDVRCEFDTVRKLRLGELEERQHDELVSKINTWKCTVGSFGLETPEKNTGKNSGKKNQIQSQNHSMGKKLKSVENQKVLERERRHFRKAVGKLCSALKNERNIEHEGVFMNNPDLENCVPGYWKRIMLDNLIQYGPETHLNVVREDINGKVSHRHRNFWEADESGSAQSISTGWEGGSILGF